MEVAAGLEDHACARSYSKKQKAHAHLELLVRPTHPPFFFFFFF
jgi:hypothetical protein